jgi:hypothetical protein
MKRTENASSSQILKKTQPSAISSAVAGRPAV